ncbi:MAG: hypothetical protein KIS67_10805 [Verrucomicrobiae bacterium]|nr:hypothetical protein [Verrucomicrobiae bacterium]
MNMNGYSTRAAAILFVLLLALAPAWADDAETRYLRIHELIDQGDSLNKGGERDAAKAKYQEAHSALVSFKQRHPTWNVKVVSYRLNYLADRIATLSQPVVTEATSEARTTTASSSSPVKLLSAGAEPRRVLRLQPQPGQLQTTTTTLKMDMDMGLGQPMKMPAIIMPMEVTVKNVSANGDITYEIVIGDVSVAVDPDALPQVAEAMKASLGGVKGLSGTATMSPRGFSKDSDSMLPSDADPQMRQALSQLQETWSNIAAQLPEEAVGVGAKWEVRQPLKSQGMTVNQTATYELLSLDGDRLSTAITMTQSASNQKIQNPAMPQMQLDVTKLTGSGRGNMTLDLGQVMPLTATLQAQTEMSLSMDMGGQKQRMTMKSGMNLRMESK